MLTRLNARDLRTRGRTGKMMKCPKCGRKGLQKSSTLLKPGTVMIEHGGYIGSLGLLTIDDCCYVQEADIQCAATRKEQGV